MSMNFSPRERNFDLIILHQIPFESQITSFQACPSLHLGSRLWFVETEVKCLRLCTVWLAQSRRSPWL
jgi:hypothetical protein